MIELGISQAQSQFTKILNKKVVIVDKKTHKKKAVLIPYEEYEKLLKSSLKKESQKGSFDKFVGILDKDFETDDLRYKEIVK
ncbi:type II toxin-antitoxin system Phd/YefM family antitoxin [Nitrosophilus labii]|uniref:type II toxin-antitoxin system Phd/YefM family antitoxin n=1 Tax=Nitrosophilus labii TaxID=2706014 RepID=UPI001656DFFF|nr:type II toxin-antitoxin system Phd/YefM family antitoxin [Nitrosophilus labii]